MTELLVLNNVSIHFYKSVTDANDLLQVLLLSLQSLLLHAIPMQCDLSMWNHLKNYRHNVPWKKGREEEVIVEKVEDGENKKNIENIYMENNKMKNYIHWWASS